MMTNRHGYHFYVVPVSLAVLDFIVRRRASMATRVRRRWRVVELHLGGRSMQL